MAESNCENCKLRLKYDNKPKSLMGRIWRWHIGWCPGWKGYMASVDDEKRLGLIEKYKLSRN